MEKEKKKSGWLSILFGIVPIWLFGPLPGLCGVLVAELLIKVIGKKKPDQKWVPVVSWAVGMALAFVLHFALRIALSSL